METETKNKKKRKSIRDLLSEGFGGLELFARYEGVEDFELFSIYIDKRYPEGGRENANLRPFAFIEDFKEAYLGEWGSLEEWAIFHLKELFKKSGDSTEGYNFKRFAKNCMTSGLMLTIEKDNKTHVFSTE